jgi:hypothetical protein
MNQVISSLVDHLILFISFCSLTELSWIFPGLKRNFPEFSFYLFFSRGGPYTFD